MILNMLIYVCAGIVVGIPVGAFLQYRKRTIDKILGRKNRI